jgi:hypothetical protein
VCLDLKVNKYLWSKSKAIEQLVEGQRVYVRSTAAAVSQEPHMQSWGQVRAEAATI